VVGGLTGGGEMAARLLTEPERRRGGGVRGSARTEALDPARGRGVDGVSTPPSLTPPSLTPPSLTRSSLAAVDSDSGATSATTSTASLSSDVASGARRDRRRVNRLPRPTTPSRAAANPCRKLAPTVRTDIQIAFQFHQNEKIPIRMAMVMKVPDSTHTAVLLSTDLSVHALAPAGLSGLTVIMTRS